MTLHEEFEQFKKVPKHGLHKIPEHVLAISRYGYIDQSLLDVLCKQISMCSYTEALNTIKTIHCLLGSLPYRMSITDKRAESIMRLNSIKNSLTNVEPDNGNTVAG